MQISFEKSAIQDDAESINSSLSFFSDAEKEEIFECLRKKKSGMRCRAKSMDQIKGAANPNSAVFKEAKTLSGAIVMLLNENNFMTVAQIVEKVKPLYSLFVKAKSSKSADVAKQIERILSCGRKKLFTQEKSGYWKLKQHRSEKNYFSIMEKKVRKKVSKKKTGGIRKKRSKSYEDTIEKLTKALKYLKDKTQLYPMIKSNPFLKFKAIDAEHERCAEDVLTMLAGCKDPARQTERILGIFQCFYHFYPLLTGNTTKQQFLLNKIHQNILKASRKLIK